MIALFIASIKAILVAMFFMHLRYEKPVMGIVAAAGFLFLGIFLMFAFMDVDTRDGLQPVNLHPALPAPTAGPAAGAPGVAPRLELLPCCYTRGQDRTGKTYHRRYGSAAHYRGRARGAICRLCP